MFVVVLSMLSVLLDPAGKLMKFVHFVQRGVCKERQSGREREGGESCFLLI